MRDILYSPCQRVEGGQPLKGRSLQIDGGQARKKTPVLVKMIMVAPQSIANHPED